MGYVFSNISQIRNKPLQYLEYVYEIFEHELPIHLTLHEIKYKELYNGYFIKQDKKAG